MAPDSEPLRDVQEDDERFKTLDDFLAPAHHPVAPPDELFEISTAVDPSYIISLIRRLVPVETRNGDESREDTSSLLNNEVVEASKATLESMEIVEESDKGDIGGAGEEGEGLRDEVGLPTTASEREGVWEESGCVLWDLAANGAHAELMVQNLVLEVLLANLLSTQSVRVMEICLGIIGNLACHEVALKYIVYVDGLITRIVEQLFSDDTPCLCEVFRSNLDMPRINSLFGSLIRETTTVYILELLRVVTLGLQSSQSITWAEALQHDQTLCRILWIAENTLNSKLLEKSVELLLAILENQSEVQHVLVPSLIDLGLPSLLRNLLASEMSKLTDERTSERCSVLDVILRGIEALSVMDGYCPEVCSNRELFQLVCDLVKFPDKMEVASSCVTSGVLVANMLSEVPDLVQEVVSDLNFLQGLLDIFHFALDDLEARDALWSVFARLLIRVKEDTMTVSELHQYVSVIVEKSEVIEDGLLDQECDENQHGNENTITSHSKFDSRIIALRRTSNILLKWKALKTNVGDNGTTGERHATDENFDRLLDCCLKFGRHNAG